LGARIVPLGRVGSPQRTQTSGAQRRLRGAGKCEGATKQWRPKPQPRNGVSAKIGKIMDSKIIFIPETDF
jgi:hypothetical protein